MLNKSVARRYAEAYFAIAKEQNKIDEYRKELELAVGTIISNPDFNAYMSYLLIPPVEKKDILDKVFAGKVSETTLNFVKLVTDKRRANCFEAILSEYGDMADEVNKVVKAEFISAKPVSAAEVSELEQTLAKATGKNVSIKVTLDPSLLGGVKVRIGDRVIDASVTKKLQMLESSLKKVKIS